MTSLFKKMLFKFGVGVCVSSLSLLASAAGCGDHPIVWGHSMQGGKKVKLQVTVATGDISKQPTWTDGPIPLAPHEARKKAKSWMKKADILKGFDDVRIDEISIRSFGCREIKDRWYYEVKYVPMVNGYSVREAKGFVVITLDGKVRQPKPWTF